LFSIACASLGGSDLRFLREWLIPDMPSDLPML
jgi:hypothetical protein